MLVRLCRLFLDVKGKERNRGGCDTRNSRSLAKGMGLDLYQFFTDLAGQAADFRIIEIGRNYRPLHAAETFDNGGLTIDVSLIFELNFSLGIDVRSVTWNVRADGSKLLNGNFWPAHYLG